MKETGGLGITRQREAVLRVIRDSERHLTANEVFEDARRLLPGISFATVYNSLRYLRNEGLIGEVRFGAESMRFDRRVTRHDHAICGGCGKLVDIELDIPAAMVRQAAELSGFRANSIELILRGSCSDCST